VKFSAKNYQINKTRNYIKTNSILFFFNGVNRNAKDWIQAEQNLKKINFKYYKVFNKTTKKALRNSIYSKSNNTINGITFFIKPAKNTNDISKSVIVKNFKTLLFLLLAVKLNDTLYSANQLKKSNSFNYADNQLLIYQFAVIHLKRFNSLNLSK
jgi:hypothetical protein